MSDAASPERPLPRSLLPLSPDIKNTVLEDVKDDPEGTFINSMVDLREKQEDIFKYMVAVDPKLPVPEQEARRYLREGVVRGWALVKEQSDQTGIPIATATQGQIGSVLAEIVLEKGEDPNKDPWITLGDGAYKSAIEEMVQYSPGKNDIISGALGLYRVVRKAQDEQELKQL